MTTFDLDCLIKKPNCFQSSNPTCIDHILTNKKDFFKNTEVIEVGISDHHSLIETALESLLLKGNAKTSFIGIIALLTWITLKKILTIT